MPTESERLKQEVEKALDRNQFRLLRLGSAIGLIVLGGAVAALAFLTITPESAPAGDGDGGGANVTQAGFMPPPVSDIPDGPDGDATPATTCATSPPPAP